jgi:hypothetical protein
LTEAFAEYVSGRDCAESDATSTIAAAMADVPTVVGLRPDIVTLLV